MNAQELKEQFKKRDRVMSVISKDGFFRVAIIKNSNATKEAQAKHNLGNLPALLLARTLTAASLNAAFLKGEERLIIETESNGPISRIYAEALQLGEVRGYVRITGDLNEIEKLSDVLGLGLMKVTRILYDQVEPIQGIIPLMKGDITTDFAYFFSQSDQVPTSVIIDVDFDDDDNITKSSGLILQALPGASAAEILALNDHIKTYEKFNELFEEEFNLETILQEILPFEFDILKTSQIDFFCRCSKEKFMGQLMAIGLKEVKGMKKDKANELVCQYCNNKYYLDNDDFDKIIQDLQAHLN